MELVLFNSDHCDVDGEGFDDDNTAAFQGKVTGLSGWFGSGGAGSGLFSVSGTKHGIKT